MCDSKAEQEWRLLSFVPMTEAATAMVDVVAGVDDAQG